MNTITKAAIQCWEQQYCTIYTFEKHGQFLAWLDSEKCLGRYWGG